MHVGIDNGVQLVKLVKTLQFLFGTLRMLQRRRDSHWIKIQEDVLPLLFLLIANMLQQLMTTMTTTLEFGTLIVETWYAKIKVVLIKSLIFALTRLKESMIFGQVVLNTLLTGALVRTKREKVSITEMEMQAQCAVLLLTTKEDASLVLQTLAFMSGTEDLYNKFFLFMVKDSLVQ